MAQVIVERPRRGSRYKGRLKGYNRRQRRCRLDEAPRRESMMALRGGSRDLNEHLGPLRRYLASQVGRPWNKVYSEICRHIRLDSAVQSHVRDHVDQYVETHVVLIDGRPCHGSPPWIGRPIGFLRISLFYVCPRTGLLRKAPRTARS
jgi:hypothetical protein